jgi:hypothetical protein
MRNNAIFAAFISMLFLNIASAQTASDIEMKFGKPVNVYSASEHIWITPEYAADGQICSVALYNKRISADTNYLSNDLSISELLLVFDQMAPLNTRGGRREFFGNLQTSASMAWTTFAYEKVTFTLWTAFRFGSLADMKEHGVRFGGGTPAVTSQADNDFMADNAGKPVMAYLRWNDRKCMER